MNYADYCDYEINRKREQNLFTESHLNRYRHAKKINRKNMIEIEYELFRG